MLKSLLPEIVKVSITIDDFRQKSNLTTNRTIKFTKKSFFCTVLGFTQSHSGVLGDIGVFIQILPGTYKNYRPIDITGIDEIHLKCNVIDGTLENGCSRNLFCTVLLSLHHLVIKYIKNLESNFLKKINKSVLSHITFFLEDDDHKRLDFNGETKSFTCQLITK